MDYAYYDADADHEDNTLLHLPLHHLTPLLCAQILNRRDFADQPEIGVHNPFLEPAGFRGMSASQKWT